MTTPHATLATPRQQRGSWVYQTIGGQNLSLLVALVILGAAILYSKRGAAIESSAEPAAVKAA